MSWLKKAGNIAGSIADKATELGGDLKKKIGDIDTSGLRESVVGGIAVVVDKGGDIVDAAGNRVTHPAKAWEEGHDAALATLGFDACDYGEDGITKPVNPYE